MILKKSIILDDNTEIKELNFSWDELCYADLYTAKKIKQLVSKGITEPTISPKLDDSLKIGIAWAAAMKNNNKLSITDILKLSLVDSLELADECLDCYLID